MKTSTTFWKDPGLPFVEARHSIDSSNIYNPHFHEEFSIGLIEEGQVVSLVNGRTFLLNSGELVLINPYDVHACNPLEGQKRTYSMLYISADYCLAMDKDIFTKIDQHFQDSGSIIRNKKLISQYRLLNDILLSSKSFYTEKEEHLQLFLVNLFYFLNSLDSVILKDSDFPFENSADPVALAKKFIDKNKLLNPTLSEIGEYAGVSRFHLIRRFRAETGITPHAYLLNKKISASKKLLASGLPLSAVAADLGFYDQSHFNRVFKSIVAATPYEFQKSLS